MQHRHPSWFTLSTKPKEQVLVMFWKVVTIDSVWNVAKGTHFKNKEKVAIIISLTVNWSSDGGYGGGPDRRRGGYGIRLKIYIHWWSSLIFITIFMVDSYYTIIQVAVVVVAAMVAANLVSLIVMVVMVEVVHLRRFFLTLNAQYRLMMMMIIIIIIFSGGYEGRGGRGRGGFQVLPVLLFFWWCGEDHDTWWFDGMIKIIDMTSSDSDLLGCRWVPETDLLTVSSLTVCAATCFKTTKHPHFYQEHLRPTPQKQSGLVWL